MPHSSHAGVLPSQQGTRQSHRAPAARVFHVPSARASPSYRVCPVLPSTPIQIAPPGAASGRSSPCACSSPSHRRPAPKTRRPTVLLGRWSRAATEAGTPRLFDLAFSLDADGALATEITQPYNGYDRFSVDFFVYEAGGPHDGTLTGGLFGDEMRLVLDLAEGHLRGTVVVDDSVTMRVHLQRVLDVPRPVVRQERVAFTVGSDTLAGVVYLPGGDGPHPGAVMVAGRGQSAVYWMYNWATLLARSGVAALVWDGRGVGGSTGDAATVTAEDREAEARAALDALGQRADVGPVGLVSYSAGGWIVPDVAAERDDVAFVVTMVGPVESLADQQGHVTTAFMQASGDAFTDAEYAQAFAYQRATVELAQEDAPWSAFERINAPVRAARWAEHALVPDSLDAPDLDYFRRRTGFDAPAWDRVRAPVLGLFGETDRVVPPEHNAPRLRAALAGNADATVVVVPRRRPLARAAVGVRRRGRVARPVLPAVDAEPGRVRHARRLAPGPVRARAGRHRGPRAVSLGETSGGEDVPF